MDTFKMIKHHIDNDLLLEKNTTRAEICEQLLGGQHNSEIVTVSKWNNISEFETSEGLKRGKAKEKVLTKERMLELANKSD